MTAKRYRVLDPHARKIGGVPVDADRTVTLTDRQARYCLDQRQIVLIVPEPAPLMAPVTEAMAAPKRGSRGRKG